MGPHHHHHRRHRTITHPGEGTWVNNMNQTAILKAKEKLRDDPSAGKSIKMSVEAEWKEGVVTGVGGKLVCYPPPSIQLNKEKTQGPSMDSYCPLIASGCFCVIMMMDAAEQGMQFDAMTSQMVTNADMIGFYKKDWKGTLSNQGFPIRHPWGDGIKLGIIVHTDDYTEEELIKTADTAAAHCPSSEIMKRDFPVEVDSVQLNTCPRELQDKKEKYLSIDYSALPLYYDMDAYNQIAKKDRFMVNQEANMTWHCQNENKLLTDALMSIEFPNDSKSNLVLSYDKPIASGKYANPVQACFFGGLSSMMHTVACRIYARGYKVHSMKGAIRTEINKRKIMALETRSWVFPQGALIDLDIVSNVPQSAMDEILYEVDNMSPTMMNWRNELPFLYGISKQEPTEHQKRLNCRYVKHSVDAKHADEPQETAPPMKGASVSSSDASSVGSGTTDSSDRKARFGRFRVLNFFWKTAK